MKFWNNLISLSSKNDNVQILSEEQNKIYANDNERLIYTEEISRTSDATVLTSNPPQEVFPKKCLNCPDHKNYPEGEIHQCPDCGKWICGRHYHGHIMKNHKSSEYITSLSKNGSASYTFKK